MGYSCHPRNGTTQRNVTVPEKNRWPTGRWTCRLVEREKNHEMTYAIRGPEAIWKITVNDISTTTMINIILTLFLGLFLVPFMAQAEAVTSLNHGPWKLAPQPDVKETGEQISAPGYVADKWLAAQVPGTAFGAYVNAGVEKEPAAGGDISSTNIKKFNQNYWYRTEFALPADYQASRVWLNLDGAHRDADVYVNGTKVGSMQGFLQRGRFDVTKLVHGTGRNALAVLTYLPVLDKDNEGKEKSNPTIPSLICKNGWGWMPDVPGLNTGITRDVYLTYTAEVSLLDPWVRSELPNLKEANLSVQVEVANAAATAVTGELAGEINPGKIPFKKSVTLQAGETQTVTLSAKDTPALHLDSPKLWWPNGYGDPNLYTCQLEFRADGKVSDRKNLRFGIKQYSYQTFVNVLYFCINGQRLFLKGGSWGAPEFMLRGRTAADYDARLRLHREMNFNVIRNIRGLTFDQAFYDACDKYGIMVWDEFMPQPPTVGLSKKLISNAYGILYRELKNGRPSAAAADDLVKVGGLRPETAAKIAAMAASKAEFQQIINLVDDDFRAAEVTQRKSLGVLEADGYPKGTSRETRIYYANASEKIKQFRNHPSIALWCVMNYVQMDLMLQEPLRDIIRTYDGYDRNFQPCGIRGYTGGSASWADLDLKNCFTDVQIQAGEDQFRSLSGIPTVTTFESLQKFMRKQDLWPINSAWGKHLFPADTKGKPGDGKDSGYAAAIAQRYGQPTGIEDFCRKAQLLNLESMKAVFEGWLDHSDRDAFGLVMWMSNPAFPALAWQTYDYYFDTTGSYWGAKTACEPVHIYWNANDDRVRVVNKTGKTVENLKAELWIYNLDGKEKSHQTDAVSALYNKVMDCFKLATPMDLSATHFLKLRLTDASGKVVSENFYWRGTKYLDYTALSSLKPVKLTVTSPTSEVKSDGMTKVTLDITNPADSGTVAFAIRPKPVKPSNGEQVLPVFMNDGYFSLMPGETKRITIEYSPVNAGVETPKVEVECWNNFHHPASTLPTGNNQ